MDIYDEETVLDHNNDDHSAEIDPALLDQATIVHNDEAEIADPIIFSKFCTYFCTPVYIVFLFLFFYFFALEWDDAADCALLEEVAEAKQFFEGRVLLKNKELFDRVFLQMVGRGYNDIDREKCMKRYGALKLKFHKVYDEQNQTGAGKCTWALFDTMFDLEKDSVTVKAPLTVSVGAIPKVKRAYEIAENLRKGKERPPNPTRQQRAEKLMGTSSNSSARSIGYRNRAIELQEQRLEMERSYCEELRRYREEAKERGSNFKEGVAVLKDLKEVQKELIGRMKK